MDHFGIRQGAEIVLRVPTRGVDARSGEQGENERGEQQPPLERANPGLLKESMSAPGFLRFGTYGTGRWITLWVRSGHVFAVVAGLRLDTTPYPSRGVEGPRWRPQLRDTRAFTPRHPVGL